MLASHPPTTNCGASGEVGLINAAMPAHFAENVAAHLARAKMVSTAVLACHLTAFVEISDPQQLAEFCQRADSPTVASTRSLSMPSETFGSLMKVAEICEKPVEHIVAILLASNPNDLYPDPQPDWTSAEI